MCIGRIFPQLTFEQYFHPALSELLDKANDSSVTQTQAELSLKKTLLKLFTSLSSYYIQQLELDVFPIN